MNPPAGATLWRDIPAATNPIVIDSHSIPPGTQVGVNTYTIHHNEEYFPEPFLFKPERWLTEESRTTEEQLKLMHRAFVPFSIGSRSCAGKSFAYAEASLLLAKTLWYFDFNPAEGDIGAAGGRNPVFYTEDQFGSRHWGPRLKFQLRSAVMAELYTENEPLA